MPWTADGPNAGFSTAAQTWLPLDPRHRALAADGQLADDDSMLALTRRLVALRKAQAPLRAGAAQIAPAPKGVLAFTRDLEGDQLLCVFELAGAAAQFAIPAQGTIVFAVGGGERIEGETLILPAFGGAIVQLGGV
jgi:alpha-glucosidase